MGFRGPAQGNSMGTRRKEELFGAALGLHMKILSASRAHCFYHFDLNSGSGHNDVADVVGTPLLFVRQIKKHPTLPVRAVFVDKRADFLADLEHRIHAQNPWLRVRLTKASVQIAKRDNEEACLRIPEWVAFYEQPEGAAGCIVSDPNGLHGAKTGTAVSIPTLASTLRRLPRFMLMVQFPFGAAKRVRGYAASHPGSGFPLAYARDYFPLRPYWLISEPWGRGAHVCLVGTSYRLSDWEGRLYYHDSQRGREILEHVDNDAGRDIQVVA